MIARIRRLARRNKGMEALQAVILLGAAFLIIWGLMTIWNENSDTVNTQVSTTLTGQNAPAKKGP